MRDRSARTDLRWWDEPVVAVGLGMVLVMGIFRAYMLKDGWFFQDDYEMLAFAQSTPFGLDHLLEPDNGHVMPGTRATYLAVSSAGWLNWSLASAIAVVLQVLAALSALGMLVVLFGPRWWVLAPLAIYLTTAVTAQAAVWWISAVNQTPVQIAFFGSVACWVHYLRSRSWLGLLGTALFLAFGLLFFQKILLVIPVLIWLMLAYFTEGSIRSRIASAVRTHWPSAVVVGLLAGGYLAYFLLAVPDTSPGSVVHQDWWPTLRAMFFEAFASGIVGGPNGWSPVPGGAWADPGPGQLVWSWLLIATVVTVSILLHRGAGRAWLMLLGYYVVLAAVVSVTRSSVLGGEIALAYRLQTDGACAAVLALSLAYLPLRGARPANVLTRREGVPGGSRRLSVAGLVLLAIVCVNGVGNWIWFAGNFHDDNRGKAFVTNLRLAEDRLGSLELADAGLPDSVRRSFSSKNHLSDLAPVLVPKASFPRTSNRLAMVNARGEVYQALLRPVARETARPAGGCGWRMENGDSVTVRLTDPVSGPQWIRLGYLSSGSGSATVHFHDASETLELEKGLHSGFVRVDGDFDEVLLDVTGEGMAGEGVAICLDTVQVGTLRPGVEL